MNYISILAITLLALSLTLFISGTVYRNAYKHRKDSRQYQRGTKWQTTSVQFFTAFLVIFFVQAVK